MFWIDKKWVNAKKNYIYWREIPKKLKITVRAGALFGHKFGDLI